MFIGLGALLYTLCTANFGDLDCRLCGVALQNHPPCGLGEQPKFWRNWQRGRPKTCLFGNCLTWRSEKRAKPWSFPGFLFEKRVVSPKNRSPTDDRYPFGGKNVEIFCPTSSLLKSKPSDSKDFQTERQPETWKRRRLKHLMLPLETDPEETK